MFEREELELILEGLDSIKASEHGSVLLKGILGMMVSDNKEEASGRLEEAQRELERKEAENTRRDRLINVAKGKISQMLTELEESEVNRLIGG